MIPHPRRKGALSDAVAFVGLRKITARVIRVVRHTKPIDERAESEQLAKDLTKLCPNFPAKLVDMPNGITLIERESTDCIQPGYRLTLSRYLKGADGLYQIVYLARHEKPTEARVAAWRFRLSEAKVVDQ
jgi:hypothetical protein